MKMENTTSYLINSGHELQSPGECLGYGSVHVTMTLRPTALVQNISAFPRTREVLGHELGAVIYQPPESTKSHSTAK